MLLFFLSLSLNVFSQPLKKVYVFKIKVTGSQEKNIEKKIRNSIILNIINNFKEKYSIVDEDSLLELSQKLSKLQKYGCSDEICMQEISNAIDADEFISGEIYIEKDTYKVDMRNTQKNRETLETSIKSIVNESFYSFQLEYFLEEIVKKLINPSYAINKKNAPFNFSRGLKFSSFDFQSATKLPQISFQNKGDKKFEILLDTLKSYLLQADMLFSSKVYEKSLQSYKTILNTIQETTRTEDKQKLSEFLSITQERIRLTQSILLGNELSELDKEFKTEDNNLEYGEMLEKYTSLLRRYAQLQPYEKTPKLEIAIRERIIYIHEKKAENYYKNLEFSKAHESYKQAYYHANMKELEKKQASIKESMDTVI